MFQRCALLDSFADKYSLHFRSSEKADESQAAMRSRCGCRGIARVVLDFGRQRTRELQASATPMQNLHYRHETNLLAFPVDQGFDHVRPYVALRLRLNGLRQTQPLQQPLDVKPAWRPILDSRL